MIRKLEQKDRSVIEKILIDTKVFSREEINVALELIDIYINDKKQKDYNLFSFVDENDSVLGYTCYGKTPMTESTFDMYWIAVNPECHNKGIGKQLLEYIEQNIVSLGGKLIVVETSSREDYLNTRMFYIKSDYKELSRIKNYYKDNDDLVVYGKYI
jgi:ribosomal protein S18 acetylase RimI-like enzyme